MRSTLPRLLTLAAVVGFVACASVACSSTPPSSSPTRPTDEGSSDPANDGDDGRPEGSAEDDGTGADASEPTDRPAPKAGARPAPVDEYTISYDDCSVLADAYAKSWLADAIAKDDGKKASPKVQQLAEENNRKAAEQAQANWLKQCNGIVGSPFLRERLVCAAKARTMERFDACWEGRAE